MNPTHWHGQKDTEGSCQLFNKYPSTTWYNDIITITHRHNTFMDINPHYVAFPEKSCMIMHSICKVCILQDRSSRHWSLQPTVWGCWISEGVGQSRFRSWPLGCLHAFDRQRLMPMPEELKEDTNLSSGRSYIHPVFLGNFAVARQAQLAGAMHKSRPAITNQIDLFDFFLNSRSAFSISMIIAVRCVSQCSVALTWTSDGLSAWPLCCQVQIGNHFMGPTNHMGI